MLNRHTNVLDLIRKNAEIRNTYYSIDKNLRINKNIPTRRSERHLESSALVMT